MIFATFKDTDDSKPLSSPEASCWAKYSRVRSALDPDAAGNLHHRHQRLIYNPASRETQVGISTTSHCEVGTRGADHGPPQKGLHPGFARASPGRGIRPVSRGVRNADTHVFAHAHDGRFRGDSGRDARRSPHRPGTIHHGFNGTAPPVRTSRRSSIECPALNVA